MTLPNGDRLELSDLVHRYAAYVDARRFDAAAELFTRTGELAVPAPPERLDPCVRHRGRAAVRAALSALDDVTRTQHGILGELYDAFPDTDAAGGSITGVAHHWTDTKGRVSDLVWYLRYTDHYRRTDAGWRFARRELTIDAIETRPVRTLRGRQP